MPKMKNLSSAEGFALIEVALTLAIVAILAAVGTYVVKQHHTGGSSTAKTAGNSSAVTTATKPGTTSSITQLVQQNAATEESISNSNDSRETQAALSANGAAANLGGAYNESNL